METWMALLGASTFVFIALYFANGVINIYLSSAQKPHHLFITHEAMVKALIALAALAVGAALKYGMDLDTAQWQRTVFLACVIASLGSLVMYWFNRRLIAKARGNTAGRRGALLLNVANKNRIWGAVVPLAALLVGVAGLNLTLDPQWSTPLAFLCTGFVIFGSVVPSILTKVASKYAVDQQFGV